MFGGKKDKAVSGAKGTTLLAPSIVVLGDVKFDGHLEVEGKVVGNIYADEAGAARVRILEKGVVEGEVRAPNVVINGQITGDVHASKHLELAEHAVVNGDVHYQVIEMVKGAQVNGKLMHITDVAAKGSKKQAASSAPAVEPAAPDAKAGQPVHSKS